MPYKDPEKKRENDRRYYAERSADKRAKQRDVYLSNRAANDERNRAYLEAHPDVARAVRFANASNRRARRLECEGKLWGRDVVLVSGPCVYCDGDANGWDHVIPLKRGGANLISNIVRCCADCNKHKGARTPDEWLPAEHPAHARLSERAA